MNISVKTSTLTYEILIQKGILDEAYKHLNLNNKTLIVSDDGVPSTYIETLKKQCLNPYVYVIKQGEASKNIENYQNIIAFMIENSFSRKDVVIALGGGVVGDLSGFVASTYMRGIKFYNIPTTLLSQVDSSIGGKTAIDFSGYKNIIGAFYPPHKVLIETETLKTLDQRQLHSGLVESIKMAMTHNENLFDLIATSDDIYQDLEEIIYQSLLIKKQVVEEDEKESGLRKVLNLGHTIGHAIESYYNYELLHGECVGLGMLYVVSNEVKERLEKVLNKYELKTTVSYDKDKLISYIVHDKKANNDFVEMVKVNKIGTFVIENVAIEKIKEML